jgi:hypothetical protein
MPSFLCPLVALGLLLVFEEDMLLPLLGTLKELPFFCCAFAGEFGGWNAELED